MKLHARVLAGLRLALLVLLAAAAPAGGGTPPSLAAASSVVVQGGEAAAPRQRAPRKDEARRVRRERQPGERELLRLEAALLAAVLVGGAALRGRRPAALRRFARGVAHLGRRPVVLALLVAVLGFALGAGIWRIRPPLPGVWDELGYLLSADTFAHGRITNPPHPFWRHFETIHVLHQPTYASKYPPVYGLVPALGIVLGGGPGTGIWISTALAGAALAWMLRGWLPGRWAVAGALLFLAHEGIQVSWGGSIWGGMATFFGGALVLGALPRIRRREAPSDALALGLGLLVLANSRPVVGLALGLPVAVVLARHFLRVERARRGRLALRVALPCGALLGLGAGAMAAYSWRITGSPWLLPWVHYERTYASAPLFVWQAPRPLPDCGHESIERYQEAVTDVVLKMRASPTAYLRFKLQLAHAYWALLVKWTLLVPLAFLPLSWKRPPVRFALACVLSVTLALACISWNLPRYLAPAAPLLFLLVAQGLRHVRIAARRRGRPWILPGLFLVHAASGAAWARLHLALPVAQGAVEIAAVRRELEAKPGRHLVLVPFDESDPARLIARNMWVYNEADIDGARVVWARSLGPQADAELRAYFGDRRVWRLRFGRSSVRLLRVE